MGWRVRVVHETGCRYSAPVHESYNEVRLTPRSDNRQNVIVSRIETTPATRSYRYTDYWGTTVTAFDLHAPHTELQVVGTSVVETADAVAPARSATWEELAAEPVRDRFTETLEFTEYVCADRELAKVAASLRRGLEPADAVLAACRWVREHLTYRAGTTGVHTSAIEAWQAGKGVCQDYAHLTLLLLRSMGIPARYVSGYLLPRADTEVKETISGESHAWIEAWTGDWWGYDPTNDIEIAHRHVWVAVGRDYSDVCPLKGIYSGGSAEALDVTVNMTRLA
ncbi:transglutaminase family protein [Pseudonocardia bannensis]|uniref:Transglutaminase family protein n=1 Tax=Pseudonocardia bannensis TaxID=630973 RepID=A0A848DFD6_9PSEU|nr:transglutaminase family protein [Pseudonocardia bannensis]NMH91261.1 transglutaminase family protein [Pseudonocardia bannensis]